MGNTKNSPAGKADTQSNSNEKESSVFHNATPGERPGTDAGYFELLSFSILSAMVGNRKAVSDEWPEILYGFKGFHVQRVAEFDEADLREVGRRVPLLRDRPQLSAVVVNAAAMMQISQVYGSFKKYLRSFEKDGPEELLKDITDRFMQVDRNIFQDFLKTAGESIRFPEPARPAKPPKPFRRRGQQPRQHSPRSKPTPDAAGKVQPAGSDRQSPRDTTRGTSEKDKTQSRSHPRRRRFSWRKKKAGTAKAEKK